MSTTNGATTVTLSGATYRVRVPISFADREDLVTGWATAKDSPATRRIFGATLALCVPELAAMVRPHTLASCDDHLPRYGKRAYDVLRGKGISIADISAAAHLCYRAVLLDLYPRADEVEKAEDFSGAGAQPT